MGSDRRRALLLVPVVTALLALMPAPARADAGSWWQPLALSGSRVDNVRVGGSGAIFATAGGHPMRSDDGGAHFVAAPDGLPAPPPTALAGDVLWQIRDGRVWRGAPPVLDSASPDLGAGAHLIAAPATIPGAVVCVAADGTVWRRSHSGDWSRSLLLLPDTLLTGVPEVTGVAAFGAPLSDAVYLATRGFGTLLSSDGGDDWLRADSGLPADVLSIAADSISDPPAVLAGTPDGLYIHRLRPLPQIPSYADQSLLGRWLATIAVCVLAVAAATATMIRLLPQPAGTG